MKIDGYRPWADFKPDPTVRRFKGIHQFKDRKGNRHGSFQVFWSEVLIGREGWYWMSDSYNNGDVVGPFESSYTAYNDAVEQEQ